MNNKSINNKINVGIVGCFQNGKSTLINCLLEDRVAITGDGISTTKGIIKYVYGTTIKLSVLKRNGTVIQLSKDSFSKAVTDSECAGSSLFQISLPSEILKQVNLIDTPGFDADAKDDSMTNNHLEDLDYAIFVLGSGKGGLSKPETAVLQNIRKQSIPYVILFNSTNYSSEQWNPNSQLNKQLRDVTVADMNNKGFNSVTEIYGEKVIPINTAWYWQSVLNRKSNLFLEQTSGEQRLLKAVGNYFYIEGIDSGSDEVIQMSNIASVKSFISGDGICFDNMKNQFLLRNEINQIKHNLSKAFVNLQKERW